MSNFVATVDTSMGQFDINCFNTTREDVLDELDGHDLEAISIVETGDQLMDWGVVYRSREGDTVTMEVSAYTEEGARGEWADQTMYWGFRPEGIIRVECWGPAQ